jgi:hypothetical protein
MIELRPGDHAKLIEYIKSKSFGFERMGAVFGSMAKSASSDIELGKLFESIDEDRSNSATRGRRGRRPVAASLVSNTSPDAPEAEMWSVKRNSDRNLAGGKIDKKELQKALVDMGKSITEVIMGVGSGMLAALLVGAGRVCLV